MKNKQKSTKISSILGSTLKTSLKVGLLSVKLSTKQNWNASSTSKWEKTLPFSTVSGIRLIYLIQAIGRRKLEINTWNFLNKNIKKQQKLTYSWSPSTLTGGSCLPTTGSSTVSASSSFLSTLFSWMSASLPKSMPSTRWLGTCKTIKK